MSAVGYPIDSRSMNRSSCASGSGYVPSCSIGFCVAITMNGVPSGWVSVSTVTCRSSMHSSSADCVLGVARLISSPSTMLAKMAPGLNSKSPRSWLKTFTPVTSVGSRSGVNWIRRNEQSIDRAMAFASMVLPTPGHVLDQEVPLGHQGDEGQTDLAVLAPHDPLDVRLDLVEARGEPLPILLLSNLQRVPPGSVAILGEIPWRCGWPTSYGGPLVAAAGERLGRFYGRKRWQVP